MRAVFCLLLLCLVGGCPTPPYDFPYNREPDPRNKELTLGVGDVLAINVWEQKELNTEATIRPDGTITMPLVGDLKAGGETPTSLKNQIKTRLQDFVKLQGTEITVAVKAWKSYKFRLAGEVQKEGIYTSDSFVTVADALAMAGGVTRFAKRDDIVLLRTDPATRKQKQIPLNYDLLASGRRADMNIWVLPGDQIYVP
ncbi:MAG: polysaccharide biosynthesis/export family protein [Deltaproteobacteria bacterium]|nr:polysaccharide biosynthesis/export family protein [Deltaproteobacteria bacterium]MDQ3295142.1 polysaccharide biosynthesis/export family protein [Myxococcota bacterium]